jgi:hypothetical protein
VNSALNISAWHDASDTHRAVIIKDQYFLNLQIERIQKLDSGD